MLGRFFASLLANIRYKTVGIITALVKIDEDKLPLNLAFPLL